MTVLIESGHVAEYPYNHARILWNNVITSMSATGAATGNPASAALTKTTYERWKPTASGDTLTGTFAAQQINAVAIAAHSDLTPTVEVLQGGAWVPVVAFPFEGESLDAGFAEQDYRLINYAPDNEAILLLIKPRICSGVRVTVTYSGTAPTLGVLMAGKVLEMQRPFYSGHNPSLLSSQSTVRPNISESGEWLGASQTRQGRNVAMSWENLKAPWVRKNFMPFSEALLTNPFVAAWNPKRFPDAVYCSSSERPQPSNSGTLNYQNITLNARAYSDGTTPEVLALATSTFDELFTFTRDSAATEVGPSGQLREVAADVARFTHDPVTLEPLGLLIEEERTNLLEYPNDLQISSYWQGPRLEFIEPYSAIGPDGKLSLAKVAQATGETNAGNFGSLSESITSGNTISFSFYFKKGTSGFFGALVVGGGNTFRAVFDAKTGLPVEETATGDGVLLGADARQTSSGFRVTITGTLGNSTDARGQLYPAFNSGSFTAAATPGEFSYFGFAQLEEGISLTSVIPSSTAFTSRSTTATFLNSTGTLQTAGVDVARDDAYGYDSAGVLRPIGLLLERASEDLLLNSDAPVTQSVTVTDATVYTLSVYGTGSAEITTGGSGTATRGNPVTFTSSGTTIEVTVAGSLDGFQLEQLEYATSLIITAGSTITRAADVSSSSASTRAADDAIRTLGAEFNASEGTVFCDLAEINPVNTASGFQVFIGLGLEGTSGPSRLSIEALEGSFRFSGANSSGATEINRTFDTVTFGVPYKLAFSYSSAGYAVAVNGVSYSGPEVYTGTPTAVSIGSLVNLTSGVANIICKDARIYPRALTATELEELTS